MAYIGKTPTVGNFQVCDAISVVNNQAAYTMQVGGVNVSPESANHMIVSLNGVIQKPTDAFTVSGSTITFASNLVTGDVINFIQILGNVLDLGVPSDATVSTAKIVDANVTLAKLSATGTKDSTTFLRGDNTFAAAGGGKVLQVLTDTTTTQVEISGTSQTATGLSIAITPSATSSKIAIFANISSILKSGGDTNVNLNLTRGGSGISNFGAALADTGNSNYQSVAGQGVAYLDSPNTTSETTYAVTFGKGNSNGIARVQQSSGMSTMIVMEIGA